MESLSPSQITDIDLEHIWHPYAAIPGPIAPYQVVSAEGVRLTLADGRTLIDGMSSWWSVMHGYNHPELNKALSSQLEKFAHVMFGGLTHEPAARLVKKLVDISPPGLDKVFLSDSGSVSVEVAMKMAIQYWHSQGQPQKHRLLSLRRGYHGDTFGAMSVCDPVTGMHHLFADVLPKQLFAESPTCRFGEPCLEHHIDGFKQLISNHHQELAAVILEPIVQGTGGMNFYSADYLKRVRELCDEYEVLLIADEIATGLGRTGKLFACEWADITPDIMCLGKTLTGGYLTLAATLCTRKVSDGICQGEAGVFMHGPTFMANPLACTVASASLDLLEASDWRGNVQRIESHFKQHLSAASTIAGVKEVRVLGAIGVVELEQPVDMATITPLFVESGIWVRPFGQLVYLMPPYVISDEDLMMLTTGLLNVLKQYLPN